MFKKIYSGIFLLFISINSFAATVVYTNKSVWQAAVTGQIITEDFNDAVFVPGLSFVNGTRSASNNNFIGIASGSGDVNVSFGRNIMAFGGDWDVGFGSNAGGLNVIVAGNSVGTILSSNAFFGIISDVAFSSVAFSNAGTEAFRLDNLVFSAVPIPASFWLFGFGLAFLSINAKRKQKFVVNSTYV